MFVMNISPTLSVGGICQSVRVCLLSIRRGFRRYAQIYWITEHGLLSNMILPCKVRFLVTIKPTFHEVIISKFPTLSLRALLKRLSS
ncbi:unnamed protein product [Allacma fusca]|uniref:Uncharacterized protein n=1 Tax=Allacma fusca TaxID=39272 RepID=A0A8J2LNT9_9HEXA|nr:unnamed protein product [Allacma fusca]